MDNMSDNQINQKIGILLRREIEARLIAQFKKYLSSEFGEKKIQTYNQRSNKRCGHRSRT